jgi:CMP-N-acetylneuraminic acid synthetase
VIGESRVLAVVPARSGSKGIPDKNMRLVRGTSLIGWAGQCLASVPLIDRRIISTDSPRYAEEGRRFGLDAPFLRPESLSGDSTGAVETVAHALGAAETIDRVRYDIILVVEPTSPLRLPSDVERTARHLHESGADSVVTVSELPAKSHPHKVLTIEGGHLAYLMAEGQSVTARQTLSSLYWRNGVCYAVTRGCLLDQAMIIGPEARAVIIEHPVVNIDEPWELEWAEFEFSRNSLPGIAGLPAREELSPGSNPSV